jgi:hypothetical protein
MSSFPGFFISRVRNSQVHYFIVVTVGNCRNISQPIKDIAIPLRASHPQIVGNTPNFEVNLQKKLVPLFETPIHSVTPTVKKSCIKVCPQRLTIFGSVSTVPLRCPSTFWPFFHFIDSARSSSHKARQRPIYQPHVTRI